MILGKLGDPELTMGERTMTNLEDELFNEGKEGMFLEKDVRDIDIFGSQNHQFDIDSNFLDYLQADASHDETPKQKQPKFDSLTEAVKEMYMQLNHLLERNSLPLMGNPWSLDTLEIQKTLNVVNYLLKRRVEDLDSKMANSQGTHYFLYF